MFVIGWSNSAGLSGKDGKQLRTEEVKRIKCQCLAGCHWVGVPLLLKERGCDMPPHVIGVMWRRRQGRACTTAEKSLVGESSPTNFNKGQRLVI